MFHAFLISILMRSNAAGAPRRRMCVIRKVRNQRVGNFLGRVLPASGARAVTRRENGDDSLKYFTFFFPGPDSLRPPLSPRRIHNTGDISCLLYCGIGYPSLPGGTGRRDDPAFDSMRANRAGVTPLCRPLPLSCFALLSRPGDNRRRNIDPNP